MSGFICLLPRLRQLLIVAVLTLSTLGLVPLSECSPAFAQTTFTDDFSGGINPNVWTITQTTPGLYTMDATNGNIRIAKTSNSPGGLQNMGLLLNLSAVVGGPIIGDFSTQIDFSNAILFPQSGAIDQYELQTRFQNNSIFYDSFDFENSFGGQNVHVWNGSVNGATKTSLNTGTFRISRIGSTLSGFFGGSLIFSETNASPVVGVDFVIQNFNGNDNISATFDNFSLTFTAAAPEPGSLGLLILVALPAANLIRRNRRTLS